MTPNNIKVVDWNHVDDFDPEGVDWLDLQTLGSPYQQQAAANVIGLYRHRDMEILGPWIEGFPT